MPVSVLRTVGHVAAEFGISTSRLRQVLSDAGIEPLRDSRGVRLLGPEDVDAIRAWRERAARRNGEREPDGRR